MKIHIVQKGDTLWKIAKKYGVNFEELKKMNTQLSNPDMIMPGMKIKVPGPGGSIKKEAPIGGKPEAKINMGAKKEMPKAEHPFAKEKPITLPVVEAPKEVPVKEAPIPVPPKKEAPQVEIPKEVPKKPFIPKMPKPIMPEIDINNYYMMNMANLSVHQQAPQLPPKPTPQLPPKATPQLPPKPAPQLPPKAIPQLPPKPIPQLSPKTEPQLPPKSLPQLPLKPVNILPGVKPVVDECPETVENELFAQQQGGYYQPMYPYHPKSLYPVSPVMPGSGLQGGYPQQQMPYPQVQGVENMPMHQMPYHMQPHGMAGVESHGCEESPTAFMPMHQMPHQMPHMNPTNAQMPAPVMGVEDMGQHQLPLQPSYTAPVMQQPNYGYPCPPYPTHLMPVSPVMPGPGFCEPMPYGHMPHGYPQMGAMPQVQGVMDESPGMAQMPLMPTEYQMPLMPAEHQMPMMPTQSQMPLMPEGVKGAGSDCGCGGGVPQMAPYGYDPGFAQGGYGAPMYNPYAQPMGYGQQPMGYAQPPNMNPYGYGPMGPMGPVGGHAFGMPRSFDESSEFDV